MNKIIKIDLSQYTDEQLVGFATYLNGNVQPADAVAFIVEYAKKPLLDEIANFNLWVAKQAIAADVDTAIAEAQSKLVITTE